MSLDLSKKNKILIGTIAGISIGIASILVWKSKQQNAGNKVEEKKDDNDWQDINYSKLECSDDIVKPKEKEQKLPEKCDFILHSNLKNVLKTRSRLLDALIIDVRDRKTDYSGGHIANSINISDEIFYDSLPDIFQKYNHKSKVILYCMYGARRSIKCVEFYAKSRQELILNYNKKTKKSHYFMYHVKAKAKAKSSKTARASSKNLMALAQSESAESDMVQPPQRQPQEYDANPDDSTIHMLYGGKYGWMDENVVKKRIDIDFCDDRIIKNLSKQTLMVLKGGWFEFLNDSLEDARDKSIISDFDESKYEQLELKGVFDKKMWYHNNEYFARAQFQELKGAAKSANFKLNSSKQQIKQQQQQQV